MDVVHDPEPIERTNVTRVDSADPSASGDGNSSAKFAPQIYDVPVEPALDSDGVAGDPTHIRDALLRFHLYGQRSKDAPPVGIDTHIPAML